jgi:hypothetical protein
MAETAEIPTLDQDTLLLYQENRRWHAQNGRPEKALKIKLAMEEDRALTTDEAGALLTLGTPKKSLSPNPNLQVPPRSGPGSGGAVWQRFAREVTDMDPVVIAGMKKKELVMVLEADGVIEKQRKDG